MSDADGSSSIPAATMSDFHSQAPIDHASSAAAAIGLAALTPDAADQAKDAAAAASLAAQAPAVSEVIDQAKDAADSLAAQAFATPDAADQASGAAASQAAQTSAVPDAVNQAKDTGESLSAQAPAAPEAPDQAKDIGESLDAQALATQETADDAQEAAEGLAEQAPAVPEAADQAIDAGKSSAAQTSATPDTGDQAKNTAASQAPDADAVDQANKEASSGPAPDADAVDQATNTNTGLSAQEPTAPQAADQAKDAAESLAAQPPAISDGVDEVKDAAASLADQAPAAPELTDQAKTTADSLAAQTPAVSNAIDQVKDAAAGLAAQTPAMSEAVDSSKEAAANLAAQTPVLSDAVDQTKDAAASLASQTPAMSEAVDQAKDAAASVAAQASATLDAGLSNLPLPMMSDLGSQVVPLAAASAVVGGFWTKDRETRKAKDQLIEQRQLSSSLGSRLTKAEARQQRASSDLSATQSHVQQLQQSLRGRQDEYQSLEKERAKFESEAGRVTADLTAMEAKLHHTRQLLADTEEVAAAAKSRLEVADQDRSEAQKQLLDARTGIRNLRNRIDESEADLKRTRVQSSLQLASMSLDLRSRQQQVDAMRGELQKAGTRLAAERQQADQQAAMLMEQLAIAQATSADTKSALEEALEDSKAAKGLLQAERDSTTLLSKAREAAVQDTKQVLAQLREADFAAKEQQDKMLALQTELASGHQQVHLAHQKTAELEAELDLQSKQQQHLLDELSQSQGESAQLERQVGEQYKRSQMLQRDLAASLKDSKEALHREVEIMAQLEAQDERLLDVSAQLQQSQADFLASQRRSAELQTQLDASRTKVQSLEEINTQLTQIVQKQGAEAAEMADQLQQLEGDRQQLLVVTKDLNLAEGQIGQLQDALQELRDSVKVSLQLAAGEREQYEAQVTAKAAADKTLYEEQLQDQAQTIERLRDTVRKQAEDLEWTQTQLSDTQSSLIDLESHLTTLEDQQATADEAAGASIQHPEPNPESSQSPAEAGRQKSPLEQDPLPQSTGQGDDAVQSAFVDTIDSIFPPSSGEGKADDMADVPELHEDPYKLFEKGKAAVQARAVGQNKEEKATKQQAVTSGAQTGHQAEKAKPKARGRPKGKGKGKAAQLVQKSPPQEWG
ncbi:hypothetical protein ABBQ32_003538 [Trebouxia sp. C0010 RCD-2024]